MSNIANLCKKLKSHHTSRDKQLDTPIAVWSEHDRFNEKIIKAFVIILKTKGCSWAQNSGCSMCGYFKDSAFVKISDEQLLNQFSSAMQSFQNEPVVKIFTSGSFFDINEISIPVRNTIISELCEKTKKISVESRPEYVQKEILDGLSEILSNIKLEVGIGLETANDAIREKNINKGFTFKDYLDATNLLNKYNHIIKTYVLVKPPFLTEQQAINDVLGTIKKIQDITHTISLNPTNVQKWTLVEYLWQRHYYRPPWLWSIIEVLNKGSTLTKKRLQCDVVGGGNIRGPHNCGLCDKPVLKTIRQFSLSQQRSDLVDIECECKQLWKDQLVLEPISYGSLIDIQRGLIQ
jgi:radical SAM enzyme (TIGR01210 family)